MLAAKIFPIIAIAIAAPQVVETREVEAGAEVHALSCSAWVEFCCPGYGCKCAPAGDICFTS